MDSMDRALRGLEAALRIADAGNGTQILNRLLDAPMESFTTKDLRRMRIDLEEVRNLVRRRLINIKRDISGDFYFEISTLGKKVGLENG